MTDLPNRLLRRPASPAATLAAMSATANAPANAPANATGTGRSNRAELDVLSDVFRCIRLTGSMFFLVEASAPWKTSAPSAQSFARFVLPDSRHLISYHVVTAGKCWGGIRGGAAMLLEAGDILVIPHGAAYYLANPPSAESSAGDDEAVEFFRQMVAGSLPQVIAEGGEGPQRTAFICGFLGCDLRPLNPIVAALPPVLHLRHAMQDNRPMRDLIRLALAELRAQRPGSREVLLRLSELIYIGSIRCHVEQLAQAIPEQQPGAAPPPSGWLAGLHDPLVGRSLTLLHANPARGWTLQALAAEAGASRSVLATRFAQVVGQPPMRYLAAWRMQLATRMLSDQPAKVKTVAEAVGYASEAAFSRAFTRLVGSNPVSWRDAVAPRQPTPSRGPAPPKRMERADRGTRHDTK